MEWPVMMNEFTLQRYTVLRKIVKTTIVMTRSAAVDLVHRIYGPSPPPGSVPIFVLHGLLGSKRNWDGICKNITAFTNKTVVAVDARNHGDSPHSSAHGYIDLASDVSKLFTTLTVKSAHILGHSMGGRTGMLLALTEPSKVASLIIEDISPISTAGALSLFFPKLIDLMLTVNFNGMYSLIKAKTLAKEKIMESGIVDNMTGMDFVLMNIGKLPDKSFGWKCNLNALKENFDQIASFPNMNGKRYEGPTLFIGGRLSYFIPPEDITKIRKLFPNADLQYIPGVGHNVHAEDPNSFIKMVVQFLSRNS